MIDPAQRREDRLLMLGACLVGALTSLLFLMIVAGDARP